MATSFEVIISMVSIIIIKGGLSVEDVEIKGIGWVELDLD